MLKKITVIVFISAVLLFNGCGAKPKALLKNHNENSLRAYISISNGIGVPSWAANESDAFKSALEVAAVITLQQNYKYFAFFSPKEISNLDGSLSNTPEEILKKCLPSALLALHVPSTGGLHKCGTYNTKAKIGIEMFNEEQLDFTVFNAQEVIEYMKEKGLYEGLEVDVEVLR